MQRSPTEIIALLRRHRDELERAGAIHIALFGSMARGDASSQSDIDLAIAFPEGAPLEGYRYLEKREALLKRLTELLGGDVDISDEDMMRPGVKSEFERENIRAY